MISPREDTLEIVPRSYNEAYDEFRENKEKYYQQLGKTFAWLKPPTKTFEFKDPFYRWFPDGEVNACHNALDIHIEEGRGDQVAIINVDRFTGVTTEHTYRETYEKAGRLGRSLVDKLGLSKGDKVLLYTSNLYESLVATLACARIGCLHFLLCTSYPAYDLAQQINAFKPRAMFIMSHIINEFDGNI